MAFTLFQSNKKAKSAEVNANFAFIAGQRFIAIDPTTGAAYGTFNIGDLTAITNGSLAGDLLTRSGKSLKVYNASGTLVGSISYDDLLNLQDASETQKGVAKFAAISEINTGADTSKMMSAGNFASSQYGKLKRIARLTASSSSYLEQALSTGKAYLFLFYNITPANNGVFLTGQYSANAGSSIINSGYTQRKSWATQADGENSYTDKTSGFTIAGHDSDGNTGLGNNATRGGLSGCLFLYQPANTSIYKQAKWECVYQSHTSFNYQSMINGGSGVLANTSAMNLFRLSMKTANSDTNNGAIAAGYVDVIEFDAN